MYFSNGPPYAERVHQVNFIVRFIIRVEFPTRHDLLEFQNIGVFRLLSNDEFILGSLLILGFLSSSGLELCCLQRSCAKLRPSC